MDGSKMVSVPAVPCPAYGSTVKRDVLQPDQFAKSAAVATWLSPTGTSRSLPTNIRDIPHTINTNSLRSKRACTYTNPLPEGGQSYSARVNTDNFVEERWDKTFTSGSAPTIVRCQKMYQTEYTERTNEALPQYRSAVAAQGLAAQSAEPGQDYRSCTRPRNAPDYIAYARDGFQRGANLAQGDATIDAKRGSAWVGTVACEAERTVLATMLDGKRAEFQKRHPSSGGHGKVIATCTPGAQPRPSPVLDKAMESFAQGERNHSRHWQSMYATEIGRQARL
eukprot:jgi/Ulvmu1/2909/UM147_0007.1